MMEQGKLAKHLYSRIITPRKGASLQEVLNEWLYHNPETKVLDFQYQVGTDHNRYKPSVLIIFQGGNQ